MLRKSRKARRAHNHRFASHRQSRPDQGADARRRWRRRSRRRRNRAAARGGSRCGACGLDGKKIRVRRGCRFGNRKGCADIVCCGDSEECWCLFRRRRLAQARASGRIRPGRVNGSSIGSGDGRRHPARTKLGDEKTERVARDRVGGARRLEAESEKAGIGGGGAAAAMGGSIQLTCQVFSERCTTETMSAVRANAPTSWNGSSSRAISLSRCAASGVTNDRLQPIVAHHNTIGGHRTDEFDEAAKKEGHLRLRGRIGVSAGRTRSAPPCGHRDHVHEDCASVARSSWRRALKPPIAPQRRSRSSAR